MRFDKDKIKENASVYSKKTGNFLILSAKWISSVSNTTWNLACQYVDLKLKQGRLHGEYSKLGRQAYDQWKQNKDISLQKDLDELKRTDNEISQIQSTINELNTTLGELFSFKPEQTPVAQKDRTAVKKTSRVSKQVEKNPPAGKPASKKGRSVKESANEPVKKRTVRKRAGSSEKQATKAGAKKPVAPKRRGRKPASTTKKTTGNTE